MHRVLDQGRWRGRLPCCRRTQRQRRRQVSHLTAQGHGAQVLRLRQALQGHREPILQRQPLPSLQQSAGRVPGHHRRLGLHVRRGRRGVQLHENHVDRRRAHRPVHNVGHAQDQPWLPAAREERERELDTEHRGSRGGGGRGRGGDCRPGGRPRTEGVDRAGGARRAHHFRLHPRRRRQRPQAHPLQPGDVQQVGGAAVVGRELRPRGGAVQRADVPAAGPLDSVLLHRRRHAERVLLLPRRLDEGEPGGAAAVGDGGEQGGAAHHPDHVVQGGVPPVHGRAGPVGPRVGAPLQHAQLGSVVDAVERGRPGAALRPVARHHVVAGRDVRVGEQRERPGGDGVGGAGRARRAHHRPRARRRHPRAPSRPLQPGAVRRGAGQGVVGAEPGPDTHAVPVAATESPLKRSCR